MSNQKQLALAIQMFVQGNEETLPGRLGAADTSWYTGGPTAIDIDSKTMDCYSVGKAGNKDYGFNKALYGIAMGSVAVWTRTIMTADSDTPNNCLDTPADIACRHLGGAVVSFADGHIEYAKALREKLNPSNVADNPWILQGGSNVVTVDTHGKCIFYGGSQLAAHDHIVVYFQGTTASRAKILGAIRRCPAAGAGSVIAIPCGAGMLQFNKAGDIVVRK